MNNQENKRMSNRQSLALLSGKGGSGKTVIALSMSKVLAEAGLKTLLVDCDMSTHGATYFFESELDSHNADLMSVSGLLRNSSGSVLKTHEGFSFIPSTLNPEQESEGKLSNRSEVRELFQLIDKVAESFDVVLFDCQAGYSMIGLVVAEISQRTLVVLEPDAVSSAALRVLHLQMGRTLKPSSTWQIFNKLTEEERPIYEKIFGGTLFPNLPPISFDWQVRAAFAIREIPSVTVKWSAFGLGVLRTMKTLFPLFSEQLQKLEQETVGKWYEYISERVIALRKQSSEIKYHQIDAKRRKEIYRARTFAFLGMGISGVVFIIGTLAIQPEFRQQLTKIQGNWLTLALSSISLLSLVSFAAKYVLDLKGLRQEHEQDLQQQSITEIESELNKYVTLIATDPSLREYEKTKIEPEDNLLPPVLELMHFDFENVGRDDEGYYFRATKDFVSKAAILDFSLKPISGAVPWVEVQPQIRFKDEHNHITRVGDAIWLGQKQPKVPFRYGITHSLILALRAAKRDFRTFERDHNGRPIERQLEGEVIRVEVRLIGEYLDNPCADVCFYLKLIEGDVPRMVESSREEFSATIA